MATPLDIIKQKREESIKKLKDKGYFSKTKVFVGSATCENAAGSKDVMEIFKNALDKKEANFYLSKKGCVGRCNLEPTVEISEAGKPAVKYVKVTADKAKEIIEKHLKNGNPIKEWTVN